MLAFPFPASLTLLAMNTHGSHNAAGVKAAEDVNEGKVQTDEPGADPNGEHGGDESDTGVKALDKKPGAGNVSKHGGDVLGADSEALLWKANHDGSDAVDYAFFAGKRGEPRPCGNGAPENFNGMQDDYIAMMRSMRNMLTRMLEIVKASERDELTKGI